MRFLYGQAIWGRALIWLYYISPLGTFNNRSGLSHQDNCTECTRGFYCATPGLELPTGVCYGGYYCTEGSKSPTPIEDILAAGHPSYTAFPYQYLNDKCPPGFFCPNGSDPQPCKPGTFHNQGGIVSSSQCYPCPVGRYCNGSVVPLGTAPSCDAGYVCTGGSNTPKPTDPSMGYLCPAGFRCPSGKHWVFVTYDIDTNFKLRRESCPHYIKSYLFKICYHLHIIICFLIRITIFCI